MSQPSVCAVLLTADRPEMTARAVEAWKVQTYPSRLLIWDTGKTPIDFDLLDLRARYSDGFTGVFCQRGKLANSIGMLRNAANAYVSEIHIGFPAHDVLIHWDSDDISHPDRIAEQVALLESSGADCVGFNEALFWDQTQGRAWLYRNPNPSYAIGASFAYWRRVWEHKPFPDLAHGEDDAWMAGLKVCGVSGMGAEPRIICRVHGGNTSPAYPALLSGRCAEFQRVPEWDEYCRGRMAL
jgi:hypothetical protein